MHLKKKKTAVSNDCTLYWFSDQSAGGVRVWALDCCASRRLWFLRRACRRCLWQFHWSIIIAWGSQLCYWIACILPYTTESPDSSGSIAMINNTLMMIGHCVGVAWAGNIATTAGNPHWQPQAKLQLLIVRKKLFVCVVTIANYEFIIIVLTWRPTHVVVVSWVTTH